MNANDGDRHSECSAPHTHSCRSETGGEVGFLATDWVVCAGMAVDPWNEGCRSDWCVWSRRQERNQGAIGYRSETIVLVLSVV